MDKIRFKEITDSIILVSLAIQISSVSISIAVSSIAFGIWLIAWLVQIAFTKDFNFNGFFRNELKYINLFTAAYILAEVISRIFAVYPEGAFSNLKRLLLLLIFYVSIMKISRRDILFKIILLNLVILSAVSVIEIIKYGINFEKMISEMPFSEIRINYFSYPLTSAEIKMMCLLLVFPYIFSKSKLLLKTKYLILILLPIFVSMILTQSRNVFLAFAFCMLLYGIIVNRKFLLIFFLVIAASLIFLPEEYTSRIASIADITHPSNESRIEMWKTGLKIFADHPWTGVADSHIREIYMKYKTELSHGEGVHLHNNFIMILATTGIFGFISYMGIYISIFIKQIKYLTETSDEDYKLLIFGSILVFISFNVSGFFEWNFGDHEVMTVFCFLVSVPFVLKKLSRKKLSG